MIIREVSIRKNLRHTHPCLKTIRMSVTVEQMSEMLGISTKTAYKLLKENKIKHFYDRQDL